MIGAIRRKLTDWWALHHYQVYYLHPAAKMPWSSIRRVGQSRLLALTIIVPFLGSLLLFNQYVVDVLTLSPDIVKRLLPIHETAPDSARHLTMTRLYFVYFGLSALGVGSALFAMLCPLDIKTYDSSRAYIEAEAPLVSTVRMARIFPDIVQHYQFWFGDGFGQASSLTRRVGSPNQYRDMFVEVISQMYLSSPDMTDETAQGPGAFVGMRGGVDVDELLSAAMSGPGRGLYLEFRRRATKDEFKNDVLTLQYIALDHSKPWSRVAVAIFYGVGFLLLLIPTAVTFVQLALSVLR